MFNKKSESATRKEVDPTAAEVRQAVKTLRQEIERRYGVLRVTLPKPPAPRHKERNAEIKSAA